MPAMDLQNLEEMSEDELRQECASWRTIWSWVPDNVKYWLSNIGSMVRVSTRMNQNHLGSLGASNWKLLEIEVTTIERVRDWAKGVTFEETKTVRIPDTQIVDFQLIHLREEVEDDVIPTMVQAPKVDAPPDLGIE